MSYFFGLFKYYLEMNASNILICFLTWHIELDARLKAELEV